MVQRVAVTLICYGARTTRRRDRFHMPPHSKIRRLLAVATVGVLTGAGLTACGGGEKPTAVWSAQPPTSPNVVRKHASAGPSVAGGSRPGAGTALTCAQLRNSTVGSATLPYNGNRAAITLSNGTWTDQKKGAHVELQPQCGVGDLDADGALDAIGVLRLDSGGTGRFYTLVAWRNSDGKPVCAALNDLDDRTPVVSIAIKDQQATVVYLTRTANTPAGGVNLKRTSVYKLAGATLTEQSHTDVPYKP
jgi:hypothetical protein